MNEKYSCFRFVNCIDVMNTLDNAKLKKGYALYGEMFNDGVLESFNFKNEASITYLTMNDYKEISSSLELGKINKILDYRFYNIETGEIVDESVAVEATYTKLKNKSVWDLEIGDYYFYVDDIIRKNIWNNTTLDIKYRARGNCFLTLKEAEEKIEYDEAVVKVTERIKELNEGWKPNWDDDDFKFYWKIICKSVMVTRIRSIKSLPDKFYCESIEIAEKILKEYEKEIKLILTYGD